MGSYFPVSGFIAWLIEHRTGNREVTGSNPVEALNIFQASLRNYINCVHNCDDHFFISIIYQYFMFIMVAVQPQDLSHSVDSRVGA